MNLASCNWPKFCLLHRDWAYYGRNPQAASGGLFTSPGHRRATHHLWPTAPSERGSEHHSSWARLKWFHSAPLATGTSRSFNLFAGQIHHLNHLIQRRQQQNHTKGLNLGSHNRVAVPTKLYLAIAICIWMRQALSFMGFTFTLPTPVCQDNSGAIALCKSDKHHSRTSHFRTYTC